jgi:hypothetical protein
MAKGNAQDVIGATHATALKQYHKKQATEQAKAVAHNSSNKYQHMQQPEGIPSAHTLPATAVYWVPILPSIGLQQQMPVPSYPQPGLQQPQQVTGDPQGRKAALERYKDKKHKRAPPASDTGGGSDVAAKKVGYMQAVV